MNGILKIPMQFFILATGVLGFVFYLVNPAPVHWNAANMRAAADTAGYEVAATIEAQHAESQRMRSEATLDLTGAWRRGDDGGAALALERLKKVDAESAALESSYKAHLESALGGVESNDKDYIFISFVMQHLPIGIIGLLLAMIFCAGMGEHRG